MVGRLAVVVVLAVGCGGSPPAQKAQPAPPAASIANQAPPSAPPPKTMATMIAKLDEFKVQICACHDAPCVQQISDDMTRWGRDQADDPATQDLKPSDDESKHISEITKAMTECMTRAMAVQDGGQP